MVGRQPYHTGVGPTGRGLKRALGFLMGKCCVASMQRVVPGRWFPACGAEGSAARWGPRPFLTGFWPALQILLNPTESVFNIFHVSPCRLTHTIKCCSCLKSVSQRLADGALSSRSETSGAEMVQEVNNVERSVLQVSRI